MRSGWSSEGPTANHTRRAVLVTLRREGPASPDRLATAIGISRTAVLQQLHALTVAGLVQRSAVKHGVGRPRHLYELTSSAQSEFPSNYSGLATSVVRALDRMGGSDLVDEVFRQRRAQIAAQIRRRFVERGVENGSLEERTRELARFQDEQGYLCDCRVESRHAEEPLSLDGGVIRLREHNCAIYEVATSTPAACRAEVQLFREVLGARVVRETHIAAGDRTCTYRIEERPVRA